MKRGILIFAVLMISLPLSSVLAEEKKGPFPSLGSIDKKSNEPVIINGDRVEYSEIDKTASAEGNVSMTYQDLKLTCKKAFFHMDTKEVYAEGDVLLTQGENYFKGERVSYNFDTQKGAVLGPEMYVEPSFYGGGEEADKDGKDHYCVKRGYITTCDREKPHYRVQSKQLHVYLGDKVTARHILFFVGDVPIFYFPYYAHPLNDKRPRVTVIPGESADWGYYVLTAWRYYFNESFRGRVHIDYRQRRDFAYGVDLNYRTPGFGDGMIRAYYPDERQEHIWRARAEDETNTTNDMTRYRVQLRHKWQMDPLTLGTVEANKMSDENIIKDYFLKDFQRDMATSTYASIIRTDEYYTTSFLARKRINKFESTVEYLPQLLFETRSLEIGRTNFYYEGDGSFANLIRNYASPEDKTESAKRVDTKNRLAYQTDIFGWLGVKPYVGTQQTWYSRDIDGDSLIRGNMFTGIDLNSRFYRTYNVKSKLFNMEINNLRHIISPTISYNYTHRPTHSSTELNQFDEIDSLGFTNAISPSLENKLQTKRMVGGKFTSVDIARFIVGTTYNFGFEQKKGGALSDYSLSFESRPYNWMRIVSDADYNPHRARFESMSFSIAGDPELDLRSVSLRDAVYTDIEKKKWSYAAGYRWNNNADSYLEGEVMFNLSPKWKLTAYERFNLKKIETTGSGTGRKLINNFAEQEYRLTRDLHCWIGEVLYNISDSGGHTVMLVFRIKAFPEMPFEFSQHYYPPTPGSQIVPQGGN